MTGVRRSDGLDEAALEDLEPPVPIPAAIVRVMRKVLSQARSTQEALANGRMLAVRHRDGAKLVLANIDFVNGLLADAAAKAATKAAAAPTTDTHKGD